MVSPVRIQLSRKKGFKLQEYSKSVNGLECSVVSRPTKYGNPFILVGDIIYIDAGYRRKILPPFVYLCGGDMEQCVRLYKCVVTGNLKDEDYTVAASNIPDFDYWIQHFKKVELSKLKGRNLACWCSADAKFCHADILLELCNKK